MGKKVISQIHISLQSQSEASIRNGLYLQVIQKLLNFLPKTLAKKTIICQFFKIKSK